MTKTQKFDFLKRRIEELNNLQNQIDSNEISEMVFVEKVESEVYGVNCILEGLALETLEG